MHIPDFDDIIFERLNKEYGAYFLRKRYNRVVALSVSIAVIIGCMIVFIPFIRTPEQNNHLIYTARYVSMEKLMAPPGKTGNLLPPASSLPILPKAVRTKIAEAKYIAPRVIDTIPMMENPVTLSSDSLPGVTSGQGDINGTANGTGDIAGGDGGGAGGGGGDGTFLEVEEMPQFKGGDINKFREWVQKKTKYPEAATINGIHGKVYITFIVESDGSVSNVKVARGVDPLIDDEAVKSVRSSPKWTPGKQRGVAVRVAYVIMLNFEL
jgi:periplasmic protein TonB